MAKISNEEKLEKVKEKLSTEENILSATKEKIKKLKTEIKKLESKIANEKYSRLQDLLKDYGINTVEDFNKFVDNYINPKSHNEENNNFN